jgi:hypothetical protein
MKVTITIQCDNAAFDPETELEVGRILTEYVNLLGETELRTCGLYDLNGNRVGQVKVTGKRAKS